MSYSFLGRDVTDPSFQGSDVLCIEADVGAHWRLLTNTYGFCEQILVEPIRLQVQVAVHAWPNWLGVREDEFPVEVTASFSHRPSPSAPLISFNLGRGLLVLRISIPDSKEGSLPKSRRRGFYSKPVRVWGPRRLGYWLSVLSYYLDDEAADYPDILEFDTQFWQGGLPGQSRRH
jgi:hypothetical protein